MRQDSVTKRLSRAFLSSTLLPFLCIVTLSAGLTDSIYRKEISTMTTGYLDSLAGNITQYIRDLDQVTLLPYFSTEVFDMIERMGREGDPSYLEKAQLEDALESLLSSIRYTRNDYYSSIMVSKDTTLFSSSNYFRGKPKDHYDWTTESWYQAALSDPNNLHFIPPHVPTYYDTSNAVKRISLVRSINNLISRKPNAVIKVDILPSSFGRFLNNATFSVPSVLYITDKAGNLIYATASDKRMEDRVQADTDGRLIPPDVKANLIQSHVIPESDYTLSVALDTRAILNRSGKIFAIGIACYLAALLISMLLNRRFSKTIAQPIEEIKRVLVAIQGGDFSARYQGRPEWELNEVGGSINTMASELEKTIQHTYVAELKTKEAENKALLSQIQAHFLFNAIDSMIALLYDNDIALLEKSLYSLSGMLRYTLRKEETVSLGEELDFIKDYLLLTHIRFANRLVDTVQAADDVRGVVVPRLILQPFVENAVKHGMEPLSRKTNLSVTARREGGDTVITIADDGAGFDSKHTDITRSTGISNCIARLSQLSPGSSIRIESQVGSGCTVTITVKEGNHEHTDC